MRRYVGWHRMVKAATLLILGVLLSGLTPHSARCADDRPPVKSELKLVYIVDGHNAEFIFVIGQSGFRTIAALQQHLETWPAGSELRWAPGCVRLGGEPLLSSEEEMSSFRGFLEKRGIRFVLVPSG